MTPNIGKTFKVTRVGCEWDHALSCGVTLNTPQHEGYPFFVLEVVKKASKDITIKLNSEHSAVISRDGITVGCQKFPLSIINELVEAKKKVNSK